MKDCLKLKNDNKIPTKIRNSKLNKTSSTTNCLKFWYTNPTSLNNKINLLKSEILCDTPDVILITETWFNNNSNVNVENYKCYNINRKNKEGGGHGDSILIKTWDFIVRMRWQQLNKYHYFD
jgi:hypothetical protein